MQNPKVVLAKTLLIALLPLISRAINLTWSLASAEAFFNRLQAVLVRNALFVKPFELPFKVLLTLAQIRYVTLQQIKLSLQVDPTAYNQRGQEHQLHQNRDIYLAVRL
jgi:hypothetical protein